MSLLLVHVLHFPLLISAFRDTMPQIMESQNNPPFRPNPNLTLMDQVREVLRSYRYVHRTEQTYSHWILRYSSPSAARPIRTGSGPRRWSAQTQSGKTPAISATDWGPVVLLTTCTWVGWRPRGDHAGTRVAGCPCQTRVS